MCVLCKRDGETTNHIMFNCTFTDQIWHICARTFVVNINIIILNNALWSRLEKGDPETQVVRIMIAAFCWNI